MGISNQQSEPITAVKILWKALKLIAKNCNLLFPIFVVSSLFSIFIYLSIFFLLIALIGKPDGMSADSFLVASMPKHWKEILCIVGFSYLVASFVIRSLLTITTIHVLSTAYSSKTPSTLTDVLSTLNRSSIKGPMITLLYVTLFHLGCMLLLVLSIGVLWFFSKHSEQKIVIIAIAVIVAILAVRWYLYWIIVWSTSLVISVVNEGCYGLEAIKKAGELLRGRRWQAIRIVSSATCAFGLIYAAYNLATGYLPPTKMVQLAVGVGQMVILEASNLFLLSVYTVYYHECKKIDEEEIAISGSFMYVPVPTHVDDSYP